MRGVGFLSGIFLFCLLTFKFYNLILVTMFWNGLEKANKWVHIDSCLMDSASHMEHLPLLTTKRKFQDSENNKKKKKWGAPSMKPIKRVENRR